MVAVHYSWNFCSIHKCLCVSKGDSHSHACTAPPLTPLLRQVLAKKMTVLYKLSKEQLSKQYHYDFGLRALKSVLVMAGGLKRQYSEMPEDLVLMRALRDSNMPKFVFEDVPLFKGLINDLFPNMDCPRVGYEDLKVEVRKELDNKGFRCSDDQVFADQVRICIRERIQYWWDGDFVPRQKTHFLHCTERSATPITLS